MLIHQAKFNISDHWSFGFWDQRIDRISLLFAGYNRLFSRPVKVEDFGTVYIEKYGEPLIKSPVSTLFHINNIGGETDNFESKWSLFKKGRQYKLRLEIHMFQPVEDINMNFKPKKELLRKSIVDESFVVLITNNQTKTNN